MGPMPAQVAPSGVEAMVGLPTGHGKRCRGKTSSLEEYANALETKLAVKAALLDEAVGLHQSLEARMLRLEEGISWKDAQLEALARQSSEAWNRANQELLAACRDRDAWRARAERLEEDNCVLNDAILERVEENARLQQLVEVQQQAQKVAEAQHAQQVAELQQQAAQSHWQPERAPCDLSPSSREKDPVQQLAKQLTELHQRNEDLHQKSVLLEEQLRLRSGADPSTRILNELEAVPELGSLPYAEVWASVGLGAADRICGTSPHMHEGSEPGGSHATSSRRGGVNVATGGDLPGADEEPAAAASDGDAAAAEAAAAEREAPPGQAAKGDEVRSAPRAVEEHPPAAAVAEAPARVPPDSATGHQEAPPRQQPEAAPPPAAEAAGRGLNWQRQQSSPEISVRRHLTVSSSGPSTWNFAAGDVQVVLSAHSVSNYTTGEFEPGAVTPRASSKTLSPHSQHRPVVGPVQQVSRVRLEEPQRYSPHRMAASPVHPPTVLSARGGGAPWVAPQRMSTGAVTPGTSITTVYRSGPAGGAAAALSPGSLPPPVPSPVTTRGQPVPASPGVGLAPTPKAGSMQQHTLSWRAN